MSKYLISTVETYRVDSEAEAKKLIEEAKKDTVGTVTKYTSSYKNQKQKGELVQEWYQVVLTQKFTDEKEPDEVVHVSYEKEGYRSYFPDPVDNDDEDDELGDEE